MTRDNGRCLIVPVSMVGLTAMWFAAVVLLGWDTVGGPDVLGKWGLLASAGAAAWTVIHGLARQYQLVVEAYRAGLDEGARVRTVSSVRR